MMETTNDNQFNNAAEMPDERPQFLKILCILSFVACGLMILVFSIGTMLLSLDESMVAEVWPQMVEANPAFESIDPVEFLHQFGMLCVYGLIATVFSLIGVIMMWRYEKIGLVIYAIAELSSNFFGLNMDMGEQEKSYGGTIFFILLDLVFIAMYFVNLKHMTKKTNNTFIQSGS